MLLRAMHISYLRPLFQGEIGNPSVPKPDTLPADTDDIEVDIKLRAKD